VSSDAADFPELDRVIHQPSRLQILTCLAAVESADFLYLLRETGLTKGNLSTHLSKLEQAGLVAIEKTYDGKIPLTLCELTEEGREGLARYRAKLARIMSRLPE
jgi:DNA-binding MarR family transcriptional regulator